MRIPPFPPDTLDPERRALHDDMADAIAGKLQGFVSARPDGALLGPFAPMLAFPRFGEPLWAYTKALVENATLPKPVREVAILAVGAAFGARYELYAHERVALAVGVAPDIVATIAAGERPPTLGELEATAFDVASALARGRILAQTTYDRALRLFGDAGTAELIQLSASYAAVSMLLNAYDVPVPGRDTTVATDDPS